VVGALALPLAIGTNLVVNGRDVLVPMAIEEPSVVAAFGHGALLARASGGVTAECDEPQMVGQIQLYDLADAEQACRQVRAAESELLALADASAPGIVARGGGARAIEARTLETALGMMVIVHLVMDVRDAMGANVVNTAAETVAPVLAQLTGGRVGVRVLTNLADRRLARARCVVRAANLERPGKTGRDAVHSMLAVQALAEVDPYRAATHNKGIMNGIDAVALATGNDWRAVEAGAHAWAARDGHYGPLTRWTEDAEGDLVGSIELPLAVGTQGAATRAHPAAAVALKVMRVCAATELAQVMAAVGLVQNLAAIRALALEGIQEGHMRLHARQIATAAGARGRMVEELAQRLIAEGDIRLARAQELMQQSECDRMTAQDPDLPGARSC